MKNTFFDDYDLIHKDDTAPPPEGNQPNGNNDALIQSLIDEVKSLKQSIADMKAAEPTTDPEGGEDND